ncbi:hypothetical protein PMIN03_001496 [Paraphaeosphaeria minitans]
MALFSMLLFAVLAAASFSDTRVPPFCGNPFPLVSKNLDFFEGLANGSINAEQGSSDILSVQNYGGPREWPRNSENKVVIEYCFDTPVSRNNIGASFRDFGVGEWMSALGGAASKTTGHGLVIEETVDANGMPLFCLDLYNGKWNQKLDYNTVVVQWFDIRNFAGSASIGFVGFTSGGPPEPGIHRMKFGHSWINPTLVHELGHVLGMTHEHQRKDRDNSVAYRCHNVEDFQKKFEQLQSEISDATWSDLCDNIVNGVKVGFSGRDFVRGYSAGDPRTRQGQTLQWEVADHGEPYDHKSHHAVPQ